MHELGFSLTSDQLNDLNNELQLQMTSNNPNSYQQTNKNIKMLMGLLTSAQRNAAFSDQSNSAQKSENTGKFENNPYPGFGSKYDKN